MGTDTAITKIKSKDAKDCRQPKTWMISSTLLSLFRRKPKLTLHQIQEAFGEERDGRNPGGYRSELQRQAFDSKSAAMSKN
jgi:hypothetical protein